MQGGSGLLEELEVARRGLWLLALSGLPVLGPLRALRIPGTPAPSAGKRMRAVRSKKHGRWIAIAHGVKPDQGGSSEARRAARAEAWKQAITAAARSAHEMGALTGPLWCCRTFALPRPKSHYRANGTLKPGAPAEPISKKRDEDNLLKVLHDGLTAGGWWADDACVVLGISRRRFIQIGEDPHTSVFAGPLKSAGATG